MNEIFWKGKKGKAKKYFNKSKQTDVENWLFKLLLEHISKPFYRHLRGQNPNQHIAIFNSNSEIIDDPISCSTILNAHFHK